MSKLQPIPKNLLPHEIGYLKYTGNSGRGNNFNNEITIKKVKFEERKVWKNTESGRELVGNGTLFIDNVNSYVDSGDLPNDYVVGSKVKFKSKEYVVTDVETLYDEDDTPHHYEIMLK